MKKLIGYSILIGGLLLGAALVAFPQSVTTLAGLAVAQSSTQWNRLKDMAIGDAQSNGVGLFAPCLYNGVTCDRQRGTIANGALVDVSRISGAITPADAYANPTTANQMWSLAGIFNGATWDRQRGFPSADAQAVTGITASAGLGFNGATLDRLDSISNANNTAVTSTGTLYATPLSTWSVTNTQSGAVQATASKALGGGTVRHVATGITVCRGDTAVAAPALAHLRDGATGAGTILRSWVIGISTTNESKCENISGLNMTGSANTAMTIEFAAAGAATSTSTVTLTGYSTP